MKGIPLGADVLLLYLSAAYLVVFSFSKFIELYTYDLCALPYVIP